jgi:hypothetical protein
MILERGAWWQAWRGSCARERSATADEARPPRVVLVGLGVFTPLDGLLCCSGTTAKSPTWWWLSWCGGVDSFVSFSTLGHVVNLMST